MVVLTYHDSCSMEYLNMINNLGGFRNFLLSFFLCLVRSNSFLNCEITSNDNCKINRYDCILFYFG